MVRAGPAHLRRTSRVEQKANRGFVQAFEEVTDVQADDSGGRGGIALVVSTQAQENATWCCARGEGQGQLVDMGGVGFTVRVNGQERQIGPMMCR